MVVGVNSSTSKELCEAESRGYTFVFHGWKQGEPASFYPFTPSFLEGAVCHSADLPGHMHAESYTRTHIHINYLSILHFIAAGFFASQNLLFKQIEGLWQLYWARLLEPFFQRHLLTSCLCVTFC